MYHFIHWYGAVAEGDCTEDDGDCVVTIVGLERINIHDGLGPEDFSFGGGGVAVLKNSYAVDLFLLL